MVKMTPETLMVLLVGIPLLLTAVLAIYYGLRTRHHPTRNRESIYECAHCGHIYAFARNRPMDRCPRCSELNDAVRT